MKRFEFRLSAVLRLRQAQLELEQAKLQQLAAEHARLTSALAAVGVERSEAKAFLCSRSVLDTTELRNVSAFLLGTDARAGMLRRRLQEVAQLMEQQRKRAIEAERKVRLLTKLQHKQMQEWKRLADSEMEALGQESWLAARHS